MTTRRRLLTADEIRAAFTSGATPVPIILSPKQLAELIGLSAKTIYMWLAAGRLDGAYRKRGKHVLIWRDRALNLIFNGTDWSTNDKQ